MTSVTRRGVVAAGASLFVSAPLLSACDLLSTEPTDDSPSADSSLKDKEAPSLAARVKDGTLPPLEERLPENPLVVKPQERPGPYGGTMQTALLGNSDSGWISCIVMAQDRIVGWDLAWENVFPNVAESVDYDDGTKYTFKLRKGMKWSDGKPFTSDDILFWYEDIFNNEELSPVPDQALVTAGEPVVIEAPDETTVNFNFTAPNGTLLQWLATYYASFKLYPRHYLQDFHIKYNPDANSVAEAEGFSNWAELFLAKLDWWANPDLPRLHAWLPKNAIGDGSQVVCERNPYYFKVDSEGRQLPYIDEVVFDVISDPETLTLKLGNGDLDMYFRYVNTPANKPVLAQGREAGNYHFIDLKQPYLNTMTLHLNLNHKDPVKREIFQNKDFRIGLSHAISRPEIIDTVYQKQGEPWQAAPRPEAPFADEEMGKQYTEYDPELANEFLDRAGYAERDDDGIRLGPDGKPIRFGILAQTRYVEMIEALQLIRRYWLDVGIDMQPQNVDGTLWDTRVQAGDHDACVDDGSPGYKDLIIDPRWLFASENGFRFAPQWANWYTGSGDAETPPEAMQEQMSIYREEVRTAPDLEQQFAGMRKIVEIAKNEFWIMGIALPKISYGVVSNRLHNVAGEMWDLGRYPSPGPSLPAQYFISE